MLFIFCIKHKWILNLILDTVILDIAQIDILH
jgi:hypothetical protein